MRTLPRACILPALLTCALFGAPPQQPKASRVAPLKFTDTRLGNGLRVIIAEDHYAPVYSIAVTYNVGSRNERKGRTGFAHLFEHMMFKGSEKVGPGEHFFLVFANGGNMNGSTNQDRTNYFEELPVNQLELGLFLESDRMRTLAITKENLDNQRSTVQEERRLGVDNQPYGRTGEVLEELAYENFPYKHSVIGSMADLDAATVEDVKAFFKTYYAPNNAVLALVGDLDTQKTLALVKKYFENIPRQAPPPPVDETEPPQKQEKRTTVEDRLARMPRLDMAYHVPAGNTPDSFALSVLGSILSGGESSRLYQKLVKESEVATSASAGYDQRRGPSLFRFIAMPRPGKTLEEVEKAIDQEIARIQNEPPTEAEMRRVRNSARSSVVAVRESSLSLAVQLGQYAVYFNDPNLINTRLDKIMAVTPADVQRVARKYLVPNERTVVYTRPVPAGAAK
jgi:zinc protease